MCGSKVDWTSDTMSVEDINSEYHRVTGYAVNLEVHQLRVFQLIAMASKTDEEGAAASDTG